MVLLNIVQGGQQLTMTRSPPFLKSKALDDN